MNEIKCPCCRKKKRGDELVKCKADDETLICTECAEYEELIYAGEIEQHDDYVVFRMQLERKHRQSVQVHTS